MKNIVNVIIERGEPSIDGEVLCIDGIKIKNVLGCVPVHINFDRSVASVGKAYVYQDTDEGRPVLKANFQLTDKISGTYWPAVGGIVHNQDGPNITLFTITEVSLCLGPNTDVYIKPITV